MTFSARVAMVAEEVRALSRFAVGVEFVPRPGRQPAARVSLTGVHGANLSDVVGFAKTAAVHSGLKPSLSYDEASTTLVVELAPGHEA